MKYSDALYREQAIARGRLPESEPCTCCGAPVTGNGDCGWHVRSWTVFCLRCALLFSLTTPRKAIQA